MRFFIFLVFMLLSGIDGVCASSVQTIPGTPIALIPPPGFRLAKDFTGFVNDKSRAGILVAIFPADTAGIIEKLFNDPEKFTQIMRRHNFTIENRISEKTQTGEAITVYAGTQDDGKTVYDKWATLISHNGIYMVTLQSPRPAGLAQETALALFRSIRLGTGTSLDAQVSALPFTFKAIAPFVTQSTLMGSAATLHASGTTATGGEPVSIYIIRDTQTQRSGDPGLVQTLYLASVRQAFDLKKITGEKKVPFAGKEGKRLTGTGLGADGKSEAVILYTALDESHKAIHLQASGSENALLQLQQTISKIAESVRLKPEN